jgi:hypothetical protein
MKIKTSELRKTRLDWAVAHALKLNITKIAGVVYVNREIYMPHAYWEQGGPLIEELEIEFNLFTDSTMDGPIRLWVATAKRGPSIAEESGTSHLEAGMRCAVSLLVGDEVEIPEELV